MALWRSLLLVVAMIAIATRPLVEASLTAEDFRAEVHRVDPSIFPLQRPLSPFSTETHTMDVSNVVQRFFNAAGLALLNSCCRDWMHSYDGAASSVSAQYEEMIFDACKMLADEHDLGAALSLLQLRRATAQATTDGEQDPPYFGFIPKFLGRIVAPATAVLEITPCNTTMSVQPLLNATTGVITIRVDAFRATNSSSIICVDNMWFSVGAKTSSLRIEGTGSYVASLAVDMTSASIAWDASTNGVRVYRFAHSDPWVGLVQIVDTLLLFLPQLTGHTDPVSALSNVNFISNYSLMTPYPIPRPFPYVVNVSTTSDIHDGDLFAKMDLDGIGPIEAFAQGTTSGHTAFALRNTTTGELFVCESVAQGIICTLYDVWIQQKQSFGSNIVLVPLDPSLRAVFNNSAAWEHVNKFLGNQYGYFNFFFGWVDTEEKNFPCFPWEWKRCLSSELVEFVMLFLDASVPEVASTFFGQALNHRAQTGVLDMPISDVIYAASKHLAMSFKRLMTVPEDDAWLYNSTKRGVPGRQLLPSEVCSSFACSTLRAAGVFDASIHSNITCTEIDVYDMFSMSIFDTTRMGDGRPTACLAADPHNNLCQLSGGWTFHLVEDMNTRPVTPQMSLHCASRNPVPYDREGC